MALGPRIIAGMVARIVRQALSRCKPSPIRFDKNFKLSAGFLSGGSALARPTPVGPVCAPAYTAHGCGVAHRFPEGVVISSLASIDYRHDEWGVDMAIGGFRKGLMLPSGLGFNAVSGKARAAEAAAARTA